MAQGHKGRLNQGSYWLTLLRTILRRFAMKDCVLDVLGRMRLLRFIPVLAGVLVFQANMLHASSVRANGNIKDEFHRAQACDYIKAEFISDVGVFADEKVRYCISSDQKELIYVMAMGTSWVVPFNRQYRADGFVNYVTLEEDRLVLYQKENGVVKRKVLGRRR